MTVSYQTACTIRTFSQVLNVPGEPAVQVSHVPGPSLTICKNTTVNLTASGAHTYTWMPFSTNTSTISVHGGLQGTITLTGQDTITGCTSDKVFNVLESTCSGSVANDISPQLNIYPNPAENHLVLESVCEGYLSLIDLCGKILLQKKILAGKNTIDLYGLDAGFYSGLFQSELGNQRFCFSRISAM